MTIMVSQPEKPVGYFTEKHCMEGIEFLELVLHALLDDAYNLNSSYKLADCLRDKKTITNRLRHEGLSFACVTLPNLFNALTQHLETGKSSYAGFKLRPGFDGCPAFLSGLTVRIIRHEDDDTVAFRMIYAICHAFKKLKGPYHPSVLRKEIRKFVDTDAELGKINFNSPSLSPIISRARSFINTLFKGVEVDDLIPRPGPGATNTPTEHWMRYEPHTMYRQLEDQFPVDEWFYAHPWDVVLRAREYLALPKASYPTSRFKFVHKYRSKPRGICIEENETQWCQQALRGFLYNYIENHSMTRGRVYFTDQTCNQKLALASSADMLFATIDMSAASDRISRELVHRLFWDTDILDRLDAVSTRVITLPKGLHHSRTIMVHKYAPMGSAVCFPIMAIVHFALIKAIVQLAAIENATEVSKHIYVYGDDIIIPRIAVQAVYDYLPLFGMKINVDKSFVKSYFRESCGVHAYKGKDVTPVYINYTLNPAHDRRDTTTLLSLIAKEYGYHSRGFRKTSQVIRERTCKVYGQLPYGKPDSRLLAWKRDGRCYKTSQKVSSRKQRYDTDTQTFHYHLKCIEPRYAGPRTFGVEGSRGLLRRYVTPPKDQDAVTFMCSPEDFAIRWRWVPEHALG